MDLSTSQCFGSNITLLQPHAIQDLSTKRSHQIAPYFDKKHRHLQEHRWFQKLEHLQRHLRDGTTDHALAEDLYDCLIASSLLVGSKLRSFPPTPYSPTVSRLRNIQRLMKLTVTQMKTSQDMSESISQTKAKLGYAGFSLPESLESCQKALAQATRQLKAALQDELDTKNLRKEHLNTLAAQHEAKGNSKLAKKIQGMQRAEEV